LQYEKALAVLSRIRHGTADTELQEIRSSLEADQGTTAGFFSTLNR
jgi:hypothetical protein